MSVHGVCFDNGMSGNCNADCTLFMLGSCDEGANMIDSMPDKLIDELYTEYEDQFYAACMAVVHPDLDKREFIKNELGYD